MLTFITRTTIDVGLLVAVRHHSMSKARERGGRVPGFSTGVQTDILVSLWPFRVLRRRGGAAARQPGQSARPRIRTGPRIRSTGLADGRRTASRPPDGPAAVGRQVGREPLDAGRKVGRDERHHEEHPANTARPAAVRRRRAGSRARPAPRGCGWPRRTHMPAPCGPWPAAPNPERFRSPPGPPRSAPGRGDQTGPSSCQDVAARAPVSPSVPGSWACHAASKLPSAPGDPVDTPEAWL